MSKMIPKKREVFKLSILKKLLEDENGCVSLVPTTRVLALPPFFLNDMKSGILYLLNYMLKKYDRSLGGIVIGYQNIKILIDENTGIIPMGAAEIEIKISGEFYIFQPKIGMFLEGIVNKKSNNHIGCLVHQYFNATILKPEDVEFDDWICKDFNVDDKIIFKVKDLDFTTLLPYIEGVIDENPQKTLKSEVSGYKDVKDVALKQKLLTRLKSDEPDGKHLENTKVTSASEQKLKSIEMSMNKEEKKKRESKNKKKKYQPSRGEDNVLSSTQLQPNLKMMSWFCSPIPHVMSSGTEEGKNVMPVSDLSMVQDSPSKMKGMEKDKNKKLKKRRREEEGELESAPKKAKMSGVNTQIEELFKKQLNMAVKDLKESEKTSHEWEKNAKKMLKQNKESVACVSNVNGSGKTCNAYDTFCELSEQNLNVKKEPSAVVKDSVGMMSKEGARNKYNPSTSSPNRAGKIRNKKDSELSDLSSSTSKSKHSRKKTKHKQKVEDGPGTREEFKNGSMYDLPSSPEKADYDKSLFTDSEQSLASPVKKKQVNGIKATVSEAKPRDQAKLNLFSTEETTTTKSESDREVSKHLKKSKAKKKSENTAPPQRESLFQKLLDQAKKLVYIKEEESPCEKKRKSGKGSKKAPSEDL